MIIIFYLNYFVSKGVWRGRLTFVLFGLFADGFFSDLFVKKLRRIYQAA